MTRHRLTLTCAAALLTVTAGCSAPAPDEQSPTATPEPTATEAPQPAWDYSTPTPSSEESDEAQADSLIDEEADQDARAGAAAAAMVTAEVWVQGATLDQLDWNEQLMETLTPIAQDSYRDRWWGYRIVATEITGEPELTAATMASATVIVPTNAGELTLTVTRTTPADQWLTSGIQPATTEQ